MKITITKREIDRLSGEVIGAAIYVHKQLGSGLLEKVYHDCMKEELSHRKINFVSELKVPIIYREKTLDTDFRCDLFVEDCLVVELKAVKEVNDVYKAQLLTYMKLLQAPKGVIINFYCSNIFYKGQQTFVNKYYEQLAA